jgi:ABC-2 type transport system permease protein
MLLLASLKMMFRQKEAILWSFIFPLFMVVLFSFVDFSGISKLPIGLVNASSDTTLIDALRETGAFRLHNGSADQELAALKNGDRILVVEIPRTFHPYQNDSLILYANAGKPQEVQLARLLLQRVLDELTFTAVPSLPRTHIITRQVESRNLTYIDYLLPGLLSMSIMQSGVFGVAFGFVSLKKRGILRRLLVTPMNPNDFIFASVGARLVLLFLQVVLMVGAGIVFVDLHFVGSLWEMLLLGLLGGVIFLSIGFALSGISKSEDQVAPLANVITLPMVLLSGVFFSRSALPGFAHVITDFFPLTYLADGMRKIAIDGASLTQLETEVMGLIVWGAISIFLAIKVFRWE